MTEDVMTEDVTTRPLDDTQTLIALTPQDMPTAQAALASWCDTRIADLQTVLADLEANLVIATRNRWGSRKSLSATIARETRRVTYYQNIQAALHAGYLVIPNFPVDAFAVRVAEDATPRFKSLEYLSDEIRNAQADRALPPGEGMYVDDEHAHEHQAWEVPDPRNPGKTLTKHRYTRGTYDVIDLPLVALKPQVLESVERALALKVFHRLGMVQARKRDPIIVGEIIDPAEKYPNHESAKKVTFFVAWWLDLKSL